MQRRDSVDYTNLLDFTTKSKVGIVGASEGFGYTTLVQLSYVEQVDVRVVCALEIDECLKELNDLGYDQNRVNVCHNLSDIKNADVDAIIVVDDYRLVLECGLTSVVESTGDIEIGTYIAENALSNGINVYMVSKETDSFSGTYFSQLAKENNVVYALANGDQPRNLVDLFSWGSLLGLKIIAAGKSSEYDFIFDNASKKATYTDGKEEYFDLPELESLMVFEGSKTLDARLNLLKDKTNVIAADVCEMNTVSNIIGLAPANPTLSYPIAKTNELADVFIPVEDGGILEKTGVVDVFYQLRDSNEASFAGGVFIVFEIGNNKIGRAHV